MDQDLVAVPDGGLQQPLARQRLAVEQAQDVGTKLAGLLNEVVPQDGRAAERVLEGFPDRPAANFPAPPSGHGPEEGGKLERDGGRGHRYTTAAETEYTGGR